MKKLMCPLSWSRIYKYLKFREKGLRKIFLEMIRHHKSWKIFHPSKKILILNLKMFKKNNRIRIKKRLKKNIILEIKRLLLMMMWKNL